MTTPLDIEKEKQRRRRERATFSLWRCCALRDSAGVQKALLASADSFSILKDDALIAVSALLGKKIPAEELIGATALALCARVGCVKGFEALLIKEELYRMRAYPHKALLMAVASRSLPMAKRALELARLKRLPLDHGALTLAVDWGQREVIERLIELGCDIGEAFKGSSPLIKAAERSMPWALRRLAEAGALIESRRPSDGATALMIAADKQSESMISLALSLGARVNAADYAGRPALQRVALNRDPTALALLLAHGADSEVACPAQGLTALGRAMRSGNTAGASALIKGGANAARVGSPKPAWGGRAHRNPSCSSLNIFGPWMESWFREPGDSAPNDGMGCLRLAIESGADLNAIDQEWNWPLRRALFSDSSSKNAARALLLAGASTEIKDEKGDTLLESCALNQLGPRNIVEIKHVALLIEHGARVTPRLREMLNDTSWMSDYSSKLGGARDLEWFEVIRAAYARQNETEQLSAIMAPGKGSPPKRI